jgi:hypothetical protein
MSFWNVYPSKKNGFCSKKHHFVAFGPYLRRDWRDDQLASSFGASDSSRWPVLMTNGVHVIRRPERCSSARPRRRAFVPGPEWRPVDGEAVGRPRDRCTLAEVQPAHYGSGRLSALRSDPQPRWHRG